MGANAYYEKIMELSNGDDIKNILNCWENFSKNRVNFSGGETIVLPEMLWISQSGVGKTNLLTLISEYLYAEKLMDFYGDVKCFEYILEYNSKNENKEIMNYFRNAIVNAAGFRNEYKGVVYIDITEWIDHIHEKTFVKFIEYLSDNSDSWHIIFNIDNCPSEKIVGIEAFLSVYFRIEKAVLKLPETKKLGCYMENYFQRYGFELDKQAKDILLETIDELRDSRYFDGYKTLNMICADLIYREFSSEKFGGYIITAETVKYYSKGSDFVKRTKSNIEKRSKIGFFSQGENDAKL